MAGLKVIGGGANDGRGGGERAGGIWVEDEDEPDCTIAKGAGAARLKAGAGVAGFEGGADDDGASRSSHMEELVVCGAGVLFCRLGGGVDEGDSLKSKPPNKSISVDAGLFIFATNRPPPALGTRGIGATRGGGARGAGRGEGLDDNIDSKLATSSVRPGSMLRRSPTAW
jgi:hypothetical protein